MERTQQRAAIGGLAAPRASTAPILVASDGAPPSASAFQLARRVAERAGASVEVVSVLEPLNVLIPPREVPSAPLRPGASRVEERRARLGALMRRALGDAPAWPIEIVLGDRVRSIARIARERGAQLVVTGHTHHRSVERVVWGETPIGTARAAGVPLLTVPPTLTHLPRCVVVAVGMGDAGARIGSYARALLGDAVVVHLVHVSTPPPPRHERVLRDEEAADDADIERAFERARDSWRLPADVSVASHVLVGKPLPELLTFADTVGADLVVAGMTMQPTTPHLPHRSLVPRLYRKSPRALLIVPVGDTGRGRRPDDGTAVSTNEREWPELLARLGRRNARRPVSLTVNDQIGDAHVLAHAQPLVGLEYDRHAHAVLVMLGDLSHPARHLTHRVADPIDMTVHHRQSGRDESLVVGYDGGRMLLTFE